MEYTEALRLALAALLAGSIIGYLLTSWYQEVMLERQGKKLDECASTIERLVAENESYTSLVKNMTDNYDKLLTKYKASKVTLDAHRRDREMKELSHLFPEEI